MTADKPAKTTKARKPRKVLSLLDVIVQTIDDAKGENIVTLDLGGKSSLADHMVVATGRVDRHVASIADKVVSELKDKGFGVPKVEGTETNEWVLIDAGDVIVHVFKPEARSFYNIERLWGEDRPKDTSAAAH